MVDGMLVGKHFEKGALTGIGGDTARLSRWLLGGQHNGPERLGLKIPQTLYRRTTFVRLQEMWKTCAR
jgi:hypothetical protein